ncbi:MAG: hypothetical protein ACT4PT_08195 [Methanobacteriota archaeon]
MDSFNLASLRGAYAEARSGSVPSTLLGRMFDLVDAAPAPCPVEG